MRLRAGEIACAIAAPVLLALLFLDWTDDGATGWSALWVGTLIALCGASVLAVLPAVMIATRQTVAAQVVAAIVTVWLGGIATLVLAIDVAGLDGARLPAYAGLVAVIALTGGAWRSMSDERLASSASRVDLPDPRPLPDH